MSQSRSTGSPATSPPPSGSADRAFVANALGTLSLAVTDHLTRATSTVAGHRAHASAALVTLLWYPDRPVGFLADRLRISHPGAVQLSERLAREGLVDRIPGRDGRTRLLALTEPGARAALAVLDARRRVLDRAVGALDDGEVSVLADAVARMLEVLTDDLLTGEFMCRLCDEQACPDARCPVERAAPAPPHRRGEGYGVGAST